MISDTGTPLLSVIIALVFGSFGFALCLYRDWWGGPRNGPAWLVATPALYGGGRSCPPLWPRSDFLAAARDGGSVDLPVWQLRQQH